MSDVTQILRELEQGRASAEDLLPLVYKELRHLATHRLAQEKSGQTLQPTALVHEAYLRLVGSRDTERWHGRAHFFAAAAEAMRRILVDNARRKQSQKRGGDHKRIDLPTSDLAAHETEELLAVHDALEELEKQWPAHAELVKLRYFVGLTVPEAARAIGVSRATGERYWTFARAWLHRHLADDGE